MLEASWKLLSIYCTLGDGLGLRNINVNDKLLLLWASHILKKIIMPLMFNSAVCKIPYVYEESKLGFT